MNFDTFKRIFSLTLLTALTSTASAHNLEPKVSHVEYKGDMRPSIEIVVAPEPKELKKAWRDYLQENYDVRLKGIGFLVNKDILTAERVTIAQMSPDAMDFHTKIVASEDGTRMEVFAAHGYDIYVGPNETPIEFEKMNAMVTGFLQEYIPEHYAERVEDQKEIVTDLADEQVSIEENIVDMTEEMAELQKEIATLENEIHQEKTNLDTTTEELESQMSQLNQLKTKLEAVE